MSLIRYFAFRFLQPLTLPIISRFARAAASIRRHSRRHRRYFDIFAFTPPFALFISCRDMPRLRFRLRRYFASRRAPIFAYFLSPSRFDALRHFRRFFRLSHFDCCAAPLFPRRCFHDCAAEPATSRRLAEYARFQAATISATDIRRFV